MLCWEVTNYGESKIEEFGFALITLRNGNLNDEKYTKSYTKKLLMLEEGQYVPIHFYWNKMKNNINRCCSNVLIEVYNSTDDEEFADTDVKINIDGWGILLKISYTFYCCA